MLVVQERTIFIVRESIVKTLLIAVKLATLKKILQKHPFITAALVTLGAGTMGYHGCTNTYSTISQAEVLKERRVSEKEGDNKHYVLYVNIDEEIQGKKEHRLCALYVRNDKDGRM